MKKKSLPKTDWLKVEAQADYVRMTITGEIGAGIFDDSDTNSKEFCDALATVPDTMPVRVIVNSIGGSVPQAMEMYQALKERSNVTVQVVSALSAASIVALGGDPVISPVGSVWMIHCPMMQTWGNSEKHKQTLQMLDTFRSSMADVYADETGKDKEEILAVMDAQTWFTAQEAVDFGLADALDDDSEEDASAAYESRAAMVMAMYRPPENIRELLSGGAPPSSKHETQNKQEKKVMDKTTVPAAATNPPAAPQQDPDLKRFVEERKARISARVKELADGRIKNDKLEWWIAQAIASPDLAAEEMIYSQIESMPKAAPADGEPVAQAQGSSASVDANMGAIAMPGSVGSTCYGKAVDKTGRVVEIGVAPQRARLPFAHDIRKLKTPGERLTAVNRDWSGLFTHCVELDKKHETKTGQLPSAANSYSSTLITDMLADTAITILQNTWAALSAFSTDFSVDRIKPLSTVVVPLIVSPSTVLTGTKAAGITNFETGDTVTKAISVPTTHYSVPFHVTQDEANSGQRLARSIMINLAALADKIMQVALQPLAAGAYDINGNLVAYSAGTYFASATSGTFGWSTDMPRLRGYLKKSPQKNLIIDGTFYSYLCNQPGFFQSGPTGPRGDRVAAFGWDQIQELSANFPSAPANIAGFACNPAAIACAAGLPLSVARINTGGAPVIMSETTIFVPGPDIYVQVVNWVSTAGRVAWMSFDLIFGASGGDSTAGALLFNGAGPRS